MDSHSKRRIQAMEIMCCRKILRISYEDHVTNEEVCTKIQQAIGPHEDLLTVVKRRNLQWYGHVSRSSGLAKGIYDDEGKVCMLSFTQGCESVNTNVIVTDINCMALSRYHARPESRHLRVFSRATHCLLHSVLFYYASRLGFVSSSSSSSIP